MIGSPDSKEGTIALPDRFVTGKIGIVTVLFNSESVLPEFLTSLRNQTYENWIVYAIDNASQDAGAAMCSAQGDRYRVTLNATNVGVAEANNQGIYSAIADGCEYVLLVNNDVAFGPELISNLKDGIAIHDCQMTTPTMYYHVPSNLIWYAGGHYIPWRGFRAVHVGMGQNDGKQSMEPRRVTYSPTCCVLIRREVFARVGMMDTRYFVYFDDTDWMLRAMRAGISMYYIPNAKLWHKVSSLTGSESEFTVRFQTRNHAYYNSKHLGRIHAALMGVLHRCFYAMQWFTGFGGRSSARIRLISWNEGVRMARSTGR